MLKDVSAGHVCFYRGNEYFWGGACLYSASESNYLDLNTRMRVGARFISTKISVENFCEQHGVDTKKYIEFRCGDFDPDMPLFNKGE